MAFPALEKEILHEYCPGQKESLQVACTDRSPRRAQDYVTIVLFLLPAVILFVLFLIYPIFRSAYYSLFNWNGLGPATKFIGLNNFKQILTDQVFLKAIENCLIIVVLSLAVQLPLALMLAIMVGRDLPGRAFFRSIFFMPYVISEVITAIIWISMFSPDPENGFINALLILIPGCPCPEFPGGYEPGHGLRFSRAHLEIFWVAHALVHGRPAKHPQGDRRGCHDRWRQPLAVDLVCYRPPAWHHHPYHHLPVRFGLADAVQPGLDHDQGRAGQCQRNDGHLHVSLRFHPFPTGIRLGRGAGHAGVLPDLFRSIPVA